MKTFEIEGCFCGYRIKTIFDGKHDPNYDTYAPNRDEANRVREELLLKSCQEPNGWANYETWLTASYMEDDPATAATWEEESRRVIRESVRSSWVRDLADIIQGWHATVSDDAEPNPGWVQGMLRSAYGKVDWREIARSWLAKFPEDCPDADIRVPTVVNTGDRPPRKL